MLPAPTCDGSAVPANISRLRPASERARRMIVTHAHSEHVTNLPPITRPVAKLARSLPHRPPDIADALALRQDPGRFVPAVAQRRKLTRGVARVGWRSGIWCLAHAVDERAERQKRP